MKLNNLNVSMRLLLAFGAVVLLLLAIVASSLFQFTSVREAVHVLVDKDATKLRLAQEVLQLARGNGVQVLAAFMVEDEAARRLHLDKVAEQRKAIDDRLVQLDALIYEPEGKALLAEFRDARSKWVSAFGAALELLKAGQAGQGQRQFVAQALPRLQALDEPAMRLTQLQGKLLDASRDSTADNLAGARNLLLALGSAAVLLSVGAGWAIARSITRPLHQAVAAAQRVAAGDLDFPIEVRSRDETGQLLAAMHQMQQSLARTVWTVRGNAESVATASGQIAQGNFDLSQRTEEQASALQQTAATMTELDATVRQTADNAQQAAQLASGARDVAAQGGAVTQQVVQTMRGIADSAQRIAEITAVIDGIAFQTNILALNAAVEAARAGEQGRGFAVVASEVRALAQRSAEAAREVRALITASVERANHGSALVDRAGTTMQEIVSAIGRVADIVGEISAASTEQSGGVTQVGQAVTQMDQVTQQNSALVEESAAAANSLKEQAQALLQAVSTFRLGAAGA